MKLFKILIALVCVLGATNTMCMLVEAVKQADLQKIQQLLKQGIDVNAKDNDGNTALISAAGQGNKEIVQLLLKAKGIDINAKDNYGDTALILAAFEGHKEIVQLLLKEKDIDVNAKDKSGSTALLVVSAAEGHKEIVQLLLKVPGIDVNAKDVAGNTALILAARIAKVDQQRRRLFTEIVQLLILYCNKETLQEFTKLDLTKLDLLDKDTQNFITWLINGASINQLSKEQIIVFTPIALTMPAAFTEFKALLKLIKPSDYETIFTEQVISNAGMTKNADALELLISNIMPNLEQKTALTFLKLLKDPKTESKLKPLQNSYLKLLQRIYASAQENKLNSITQLILKDMELLRTKIENLPPEISGKIGSFVSKD